MPAKTSALDALADFARDNARSSIDRFDAILRRLSALVVRLPAGECSGVVAQLLPMRERLDGLTTYLEHTHPAEDASAGASS